MVSASENGQIQTHYQQNELCLKRPHWDSNPGSNGSSTHMFKDASSQAEAQNRSKSEATAEDLAPVLCRGLRTLHIEHISGGTGLYPTVYSMFY